MIVEYIANISKKNAQCLSYGTSSNDFYLSTSVDKLKKLFGMYGKSDPYKVKAEWVLLFYVSENKEKPGKIIPITIYDYKEYKPLKDIRDWHIGNHGENNQEVALITNWIKEKLKEVKQ